MGGGGDTTFIIGTLIFIMGGGGDSLYYRDTDLNYGGGEVTQPLL